MENTLLFNFPDQDKLRDAFNADPLNDSGYARSNHQSSSEKLPSLSSFSQSRADNAMGTYLSNKIYGKKKKSDNFATKIGPKEIKLDPSRVVVFKKGRMLNQGYFIIEFSYTQRYFCIAAFDIETNDHYVK